MDLIHEATHKSNRTHLHLQAGGFVASNCLSRFNSWEKLLSLL